METGSRYTPEMAVDLQIAADVQVSPDGHQVLFTVAPVGHIETNPATAIVYGPADGSLQPDPLTDRTSNNSSPRWSPDGRMIAYLSDRAKRGTQQLYISQSYPGEPLQLTRLDGGVAAPAWAPDGESILVTATRKAIAGEKQSSSEIKVASERIRPRGIARVPRLGGPAIPVGPSEDHVWSFAISPDGSRLATFTSDDDTLTSTFDNVYLSIGPIDGGEPDHRIGPFHGAPDRVVWSADGKHVAFIASRLPDHRYGCVWVVDTQSGSATSLDDRGMTQSWVAFHDGGLLVQSVEGQRTRLDSVSLDGAQVEVFQLPEGPAGSWLRAVSVSADGQTLACIAEPDTAPGDVWTVDANSRVRRLTDLNPQLASVDLTNLEPLSWESSDGMTSEGWLVRPPHGPAEGPYPIVVYVHGGPSFQWGNWFHGTWHDWAHNLAARGFAVFLPNPRGSTGRGGSFTGANQSDLGGMDFQDIMTGVDHLVEQGIADNDRLGIGGWSYGGFITAWAIGQTDRFKAAVAGAAVTNWVSKVGTTDIRRQNESNFPAPLHENPDALWEGSPIRYLGNMKTPTLIVHGEADPRVPVTQGMELYLGLKAVGVDTEYVTYPRQGHAFHERAFQLDLLQRICDWYERYLLKD